MKTSLAVASPANTVMHRLDALSKLVALLCLSLLTMHINEVVPSFIVLFCLLVLCMFTGNREKLVRRFLFIGSFALPLFILTTLSAPQGGERFDLGLFTVSTSAIEAGIVVSFRMIILFLSSMVYIETTNPRHFLVMLTHYIKLPYRFVFGVSVALAFVPLLEEEAKMAIAARKLRRGKSPQRMGEFIEMWKGSLLSIFTGAIRRISITAGAMDAKGFGAYPTRTYVTIPKIQASGYCVMILSVLSLCFLWGIV